MKTTRTRTFTIAVLAGSLAFSGVAGAFESSGTLVRTTRASVSSTGAPAVGAVLPGVISANGRYVVFISTATNLVVGVSGQQVYRRDRTNGATALVTVSKTGSPSTAPAFAPTVSADGRFVAFASAGNDFVDGAANATIDVFLRDMVAGTTALVSASQTGQPGDLSSGLNSASGAHLISDDGRYVAFTSNSTNLVLTPNNGKQQVYVKDMVTGVVTRASVDASDAAGNDTSSAPALSGNGRVVAFLSQAANFSSLSTSHTAQLFVRDLEAGTTTLESVTTTGVPVLARPASAPALSFDGHFLAFESEAQLEPRDRDLSNWDVFLRDRGLRTTVLASLSSLAIAGAHSRAPSISADGRWVGFQSLDDTLVPGDLNRLNDVFLYDRSTEAVTLVSVNDAGEQANAHSTSASVSSDGRFVVLMSSASNLVTSPSSTGSQLYVRDMRSNEPPVVALGPDQSLDEGVALSLLGSFSDPDASTSWAATVDYGDGAGSAMLTLAANKTFTLEHLLEPGSYVVTVVVTDDAGASGTGSFRVTVTNVAPTVNLGGPVELTFDSTLRRSGTFSDPGTTETYWATVDYGDGSGGWELALTGNSFLLDHVYGTPGTYTVTVTVTDSEGDSGSANLTVNVRRFSFQWHEPVESSFTVGRLLPVRFSVLRADGTPVLDTSVRVEVLDASGAVVTGYIYGVNPSGAVNWNGAEYHVNVDTRGFAPGDYTLRVSFSSPTLTGEFTKQTTVTADALTGSSNGKGKGQDKADKADKADKDKKEK
ncbi:MAG: PKD domain-containing protein [Candidatus Limnocylindria bacterium]